MEKTNATISIANGIINSLKKLPLPFAVSFIGYLVSIPVFCDAAFVILSQLNKTLSNKTKTPLIGLTVALSTGLFAPHVLVPPTPGPLAAAANLKLDNIFLLIIIGAFVAFILVLVGAFYANYLANKSEYQESIELKNEPKIKHEKEVAIIATLPSLEEARAKIVGILASPAQKLVSILLAPGSKIANLARAKSLKN